MNKQNAQSLRVLTVSAEKLLTARECAERLGYKGETAYRRVIGLANRGMLPVIRLGTTLRFHWPSVLKAQHRPISQDAPGVGGKEEPRKSPPSKHQSRLGSGRPDRAEAIGRLSASRTLQRGNADLLPEPLGGLSRENAPKGASDRIQRAAVVKARRGPIPPRINSNPYL